MHVLRWHEENSFFIASAYDLSFVRFIPIITQLVSAPIFQRNCELRSQNFIQVFKSFINSRTKVGESISVHLPEAKAKCYLYISKDQYAFCILADDQYPERVAFMAIRKMMNEYSTEFGI